jgi:Poxvirus D5 protein-like
MLRAHRLQRVGDSTSRAFRTAHWNRLRCRRVMVPSKYACSTFFQISSIPVASLGDSHRGRVRATETSREAFSACAFASRAFIPWTGHKYLSSCSRMSHSQGQSHFAPEERDHLLLETLKAELPGILQWAIRGCLEWQQRGLDVPECLKQATEDYRREQNVLGHFVEDELMENGKLKAACGQIYEHYKIWADKNGEYQMTTTEFKKRMAQRYGEPKRTSAGKFWVGVGIKHLLSEPEKWMLEGKTVEDVVSAIH